jgi:hypothetical protein
MDDDFLAGGSVRQQPRRFVPATLAAIDDPASTGRFPTKLKTFTTFFDTD